MATTDLRQWNTFLSERFAVSTILQCCYVVVGVLGNFLVIMMYRFKMRNQKEDRFFIPVLAVVDLTGCVTSASLSLTQNLFPVMFPADVVCKFLFFSTSVTIISSLLLLFVISVQRYQKICRPFGWQMTERHKYCCVALTVFCAGLLSVPVLVLYGNHPIHKTNITGVVCGVGTGKHTDLAVYNYVILSLECIVVGIMSFLYFLVGKRVFYSFKSMKSYKRKFSISKNSNAAVHCPSEDESFISKESAEIKNKDEEKRDETQLRTENAVVISKENKNSESIPSGGSNTGTETMSRPTTKKKMGIERVLDRGVDINDHDPRGTGLTESLAEGGPIFSLEAVDAQDNSCAEEVGPVEKDIVDVYKSSNNKENKMSKQIRNQNVPFLSSKRNESVPVFEKQRNLSTTSFSKRKNQSAPSFQKNRNQSVSSFKKDRKTSNVDSISSNKNSCAVHRYTIMFIVISFVAIVTYIPPWIFIIMETQDHEFWSGLTYGESMTFLIIRRIYIINHVVNPVIYGLFDGRFRYALKKMLCPKVDINF